MTRRPVRSRARRLALQALYQWRITVDDPATILEQFLADGRVRAEAEYFEALFVGATRDADELDRLAADYLDRPLAQLDPIEHAVLWISLLEFRDHPETPYRVVINEAIELARDFGGEAGHKYINAVLDRAVADLRPTEVAR
jgi:N utilization substance protein B